MGHDGRRRQTCRLEPKEATHFIDLAYAKRRTEGLHVAHAILTRAEEIHPTHGTIQYNLACYAAMAGRREDALGHLEIAFAGNPQTREWAAGDSDLSSLGL